MIETVAVSAIVIISVLLYGSVELWSIAIVGITTILFFNVWLFKGIKRDKKLPSVDRPLLLTIVTFAVFCLFQIIPMPVYVLRMLSPEKYSLIEMLSLPGFHSISLYPYATMHAILKFILYLMIFFMSFSIAAKRTYLIHIIKVIVSFGFLLALFALIQEAAWNGKIYWFRELSMGGTPFGPFVNKNHFAGLIGMIVPFGLALGIQSRDNAKRFLYIFFSVVMSFALFYSLSRGGIISFIFSIILFSVLMILRETKSKAILVSGIFVTLLISYLAYFGLSPILERFATTDMTLNQRVTVWLGFLKAAGDFWLTGSGFGTFKYLSPLYHPEGISAYFDHAHNDYLEFFIEMGLIGSVILMGFIATLFRNILNSKWRHSSNFYFVLAGICSFASIAIHSLVDFNLHIPSNAIMLSVVLGLVYGMTNNASKR